MSAPPAPVEADAPRPDRRQAPLHEALARRDPELALRHLAAGARAAAVLSHPDLADDACGLTDLQWVARLLLAARKNQDRHAQWLQVFRALLAAGADPHRRSPRLDHPGAPGSDTVGLALLFGHRPMLEALPPGVQLDPGREAEYRELLHTSPGECGELEAWLSARLARASQQRLDRATAPSQGARTPVARL